jgi:hypothetical protein
MKLVFDIDGVISDYNYSDICKRYLGIDYVTNSNVTEYNMSNILGITESEVYKLFKGAVKEPLHVQEGAIEVLTDIINSGSRVYIWTHRFGFDTGQNIQNSLKIAGVPFTELINSLNVIDHFDRSVIDAVFDDNVFKLLEALPYCKNLFLYRQPWNKNCLNTRRYFKWVYNWDNIRDALTKIGI